MRTRWDRALVLAATLASGGADATIDTLQSCGINWGGNTVGLARGWSNDVTVTGFGVDLATSVTATLPGTPVTVLSRKNGPGSNIVIRLALPSTGAAVNGTVTLHYFGGGTDIFNVDAPAGPTIGSIAFAPGRGVSTSGGITRVTSVDPHVVVLKGAHLDAVGLDDTGFQAASLRDARIVLQLPGELDVSFTSDAGDRQIGPGLFTVVLGQVGDCRQRLPDFALGFTVFDPPRTPTPTATVTPTGTPTPTRTPTPLPFHPIAPPSGIRTPFPPPTPTPTPGFRLLPPPLPTPGK